MIFLAEDAEQICLVVVWRLEQVHPLQHLDLTGGTARAAARKRNGCPYFVADVEQVTTFRSIDDLGSARAACFEFYRRHATRCSESTPAEQPGFGRETLSVLSAFTERRLRRAAAAILKRRGSSVGTTQVRQAGPASSNRPTSHGPELPSRRRMLTFEHGGRTIAPMGWV